MKITVHCAPFKNLNEGQNDPCQEMYGSKGETKGHNIQ